MSDIKQAVDSLFKVKQYNNIVDSYARNCYKEKFKDLKKRHDEFHYYSGFEVLSENKIRVKYSYGVAMYDYDDSFEVEII